MTTQREEQLLQRLREATLALRDTLDERDALLAARSEPIAVVGVGCRFPGGADDPARFWELLRDGRDAIGPLAPRWQVVGGQPGPAAPRWAGLLTGAIDGFDPSFFGISPREAAALDPQQRLLLEVGWEALEDAGIPPHVLKGSRTGVFVGATNLDYAALLARLPPAQQDAYTITGNLLSVAAGRLSYTWGLQGPCMTIDTVCSSSLVAVHLACQSLRAGESDLALAGGVNLILAPESMDGVSRTQALAPDGRCKTFDALANGFARGEGCGVVALKRLRDAKRAGDPILAVIRGSAVNQDGASTGLTAPNVRAQEAMLRDALANAHVAAEDIGFVETHGTGTSLGDPIEVEALRAVLGAPRADGSRCLLGAVKTNLGHLEAAAGIAGLIKTILALQHESIPPNLHFRATNPRIRLEDSALALATAQAPWPRGGRPRVAGVSAFGLSGTNAHVILEEAPVDLARGTGAARAGEVASGTGTARAHDLSPGTGTLRAHDMAPGTGAPRAHDMAPGTGAPRAHDMAPGTGAPRAHDMASGTGATRAHDTAPGTSAALAGELASGAGSARAGELASGTGVVHAHELASDRGETLVVLSAKSAEGLAAVAGRLGEHLADAPTVGLADLAFSLATTRSPLEQRAAVVARSREELAAALARLAAGETPPEALRGAVRPTRGALAFLFTGQGAQVIGMGRELAAAWPAFRAAFAACAALLDRELERPLTEVMWAEPGSAAAALLDQTLYTQPALFAFQVGLLALWRSWGIEPALLAGHSVGELSAAYAAGVFSLADAARLVAARARLMQAMPAGAMVAVTASEAEVRAVVEPLAAEASIAAINGPEQVVVAGTPGAVAAIAATLAARGHKTRALPVSHAFHSPMMEPMLAEFGRVAATVTFAAPGRPVVSNVSGTLAGPEMATAAYWVRHARAAVRFADGVRALHEAGARTFVEVGPRPALLAGVPSCLPGVELALVASLRGGRAETTSVLAALGSLWAGGAELDWRGVFVAGGRRVPLPHYPWQRQRCWFEAPRTTVDVPADGARATTVGALYDAVARGDALADGASEIDGGERYLTFAPFAAPVAGFSWVLATVDPAGHPEQARQVVAAQRAMREVLFRGVELARCADVLDFGCGYATDLLRLGETHPHLKLHGYTLSAEQARIGGERARRAGLAGRVEVFQRDSAAGPYVRDYDLMIGVEVVCHVRDKEALFERIGAHLRPGGTLVLSDFVSGLSSDIEHEEAGSFLATAERWVEVLSRNGLKLVECVDVSREIANFLDDPAFERNVATVGAAGTAAALKSYDQLGRLLRRRMASYVLMTARRVATAPASLAVENRRALAERTPYAAVAGAIAGREDDDGRYLEVAWEPAVVPRESVRAGRWLVLGDCDGLATELRAALAEAGQSVVVAEAARGPGEVRARLSEAFQGAAPTAVVHLGALTAAIAGDAVEAASRAAEAVLATVQALAGMRWRDPPRLWLVTRGAQAVAAGDDVAPVQAPVLGLGRVIATEHAELRCVRVDLPSDRGTDDVAALARELLADDAEDEVALRGGGRFVARLVRQTPQARPGGPPVRDGAAYLVTGGLGALGLEVAAWLAEQGAGHVVLVGRRGATDGAQQAAIDALTARGVRVTVARADVTAPAELEQVLAAVRAAGAPLRGVVHAAGVADPAMLVDLTPARLRSVLAPKLGGALLLDALTRAAELDFFVLYASVSGLLGLPGTGNYAAANAALDAVAHHRRARGLPALSVDWGIFTGLGLAARADERAAAAFTAGLRGMTSGEGLLALSRLLASDRTQVAVAPFDGAQWVESYPVAAASRRLAPLFAAHGGDAGTAARELRAQVLAAEPSMRAGLMLLAIRGHAAHVLRIAEAALDVQAPLTSLGMDSLMGLELRNRIEVALGIRSPATLLWTYPTVAALSEHLLAELGAPSPAPAEELSREAAQRLIDEEFDALL
ncbi:type I polyketide synthase [Nannocystis punicea]|uniref:SDR family NAD(P)-dependent oxidoreductase n=1 Tax=Nannocystis punicea TaxID=2995304 RepID=A0ABY7HBX8_9BACT|nr:type I polyketide synthase [Nannocystis poenicansa]WAS96618.1 SDR family NAD(P)-dependent oxidoreductase [Nannocystis poenicansa]